MYAQFIKRKINRSGTEIALEAFAGKRGRDATPWLARLLGGKLSAGVKPDGGREERYIFLSMTRLNEAFVRREYELCGVQVTSNIGSPLGRPADSTYRSQSRMGVAPEYVE